MPEILWSSQISLPVSNLCLLPDGQSVGLSPFFGKYKFWITTSFKVPIILYHRHQGGVFPDLCNPILYRVRFPIILWPFCIHQRVPQRHCVQYWARFYKLMTSISLLPDVRHCGKSSSRSFLFIPIWLSRKVLYIWVPPLSDLYCDTQTSLGFL